MQHGRGSEQLSFTNSLKTCRPTKNGRYNLLKNQDDVPVHIKQLLFIMISLSPANL